MADGTSPPLWTPARRAAGLALLAVWFGTAAFIGRTHMLENTQASFLPPVALTVIIPVLAFLALYALLPRFRAFVLAQDIAALTTLQLWRVIGFGMLVLAYYGVLPGLFALPAGLGDLAVGIAAFWIVLRLQREPDFAKSDRFVWFHYAGLLDFLVAVGAAGLSSGAFPGLVGSGPVSGPMDVWPLNLFPSFGVPLFIILHLAVLFKVRHLRSADGVPARVALAQ